MTGELISTGGRLCEQDQPVAVIGLSCRLPKAPDPASYWRMLRDGGHGISTAPADRFGPVASHQGGFLDQVDRFDPGFFGISPREAQAMDPQQRLTLELAWEALEDARIVPGTLAGGSAGVFIGAIWDDYTTLLYQGAPESLTSHTLTGIHRGIIANRVSYTLGIHGPSLTVDAAQASALVAVHLACESLRRGETTLALAGGVNLQVVPESTLGSARFGGLSPDGRCFTFDARANGYVRGEGGGIVVLKPLADALAAGDRIYSVIRGSAVNNDGATPGLTVPSAEAQQAVITAACQNAGVDPAAIQYVELHGTGTKVGDPIEAAALGAALGTDRAPGRTLAVGSAKTNIGHLEGAAGIVGLIKTVLSITHRELPPSLNFETPNPDIDLAGLGLRVQTAHTPWPRPEEALLAGVSSFGMGGTNCHVVVAEPPVSAGEPAQAGTADRPVPWALSGRTRQALRTQAARLIEHLDARPETSVHDVGWSLATTRTAFRHRAVILGSQRQEFVTGLQALADETAAPGLVQATAGDPGKTVLVFPGQGSQWAGMTVDLLDSCATYREALEDCCSALAPHIDWSPLAVLRGERGGERGAPPLDRVDVVQPLIFAVMVSLARVWQASGIRPDAVVGHSQGEIAAAHVAGALSLADAARVVALRSQALTELAGTGGMASVGLPVPAVETLLERWTGALGIAAVNGPAATVVSGAVEPLAELVASCKADGARARLIPVDYASHSPLVAPIRERLLADLSGIQPNSCQTAFYSAVTGDILDTAALDAEYWYTNLCRPVLFDQAVRALARAGHRTFVEASPHAVLTLPIQETLEDAGVEPLAVVGTLRRGENGPRQLLGAVAELHTRGVPISWTDVFRGTGATAVTLPTYAFQRDRHWPAFADDIRSFLFKDDSSERAQPDDPAEEDSAWAQRLAGRPELEQRRILGELVRSHIAVVLGHATADAVDPGISFKELGFDSPMALALRNRLVTVLGMPLSTTVIYNHPTPDTLVSFLLSHILGHADEDADAAGSALVAAAGGVDDPVVVVGMGCRFPGGVAGPEDLWRLVAEGVDAVGDFPANRGWDATALFDPDPDAVGKTYVRQGGFLYDADQFDAAFFDISPREALALDPQQRVLLEVGWEVFERAGITPATVRGSQVGVFTGVVTQEYVSLCRTGDEGVEGYLLTGTTASVASGRLAYVFGFEGPAVTVDTACSSSLVAVHLACQALRAGECTMALAGGAAVMATPGMFLEFSRQRGLAPDGRCKSFAATADGTIWAEGAGLILLERLSAAQAAGHKILAVIAGSAINQDGASNGLTAPSGPAQQRVIRAALASAGLAPDEVDAVEAHGTGTTLGDPIEAQALIATYGQHRPAGQPLWLGSLKSNIGHAQAAAGIGGIIKMIQAIGHGMLPQTLHVDQPTPHVDWAAGQVELLTQPQPWPGTGRPRRAAVSSFGISGTNAHLILAQPPDPTPATSHSPASGPPPQAATPAAGTPAAGFPGAAGEGGEGGVVAWLVSGKTRTALAAAAGQLATHLEARPDLPAPAVAAALATGRTHHTHRAAAIATTRQDLLSGLQAIATSQPTPRAITVTGTAPASGPPKLAFLCTGQGSWQPGTGRQLHHTYPAFAQAFDQAAQALARHLDGPPIHDLLWGNHQVLLTQTRYAQPALFTLETALFHLLADHGITPDYLAGHSLGELIAAHLAGVLSLDDAAALVATRGQLMHTTPTGVMIAIAASDDEITPLLGPGVTIAALNTPQLTVIAGDPGPTTALAAHFTNLGRKTRQLAVAHAFHSPHMDAITGPFTHAATQPTYHPPTIPLISALTGTDATPTQLADPAYWAAQLTAPVRFHHALTTLHGHGITHYLELGPDTTLTTLTRHTHPDTTAIPTLNPPTPEPTTLTTAIATLHTHGTPTTWTTTPPHPQHHPTLPTYPFQHTHYWLTDTRSGGAARFGQSETGHPVLTTMAELPDSAGHLFTGRVSVASHSWTAEHAIFGSYILPGVAFVDLLLHAAAQVGCDRIEELTHHVFLAIPEHGALQLRVLIERPDDQGLRSLAVHSRPEDAAPGTEWTCHATALLGTEPVEPDSTAPETAPWPPATAQPIDVTEFYRRITGAGFGYGPLFRGIRAAWRDAEAVYAEIALPDGTEPGSYGIHPGLLDSALQPAALVMAGQTSEDSIRVPFSWSRVSLHEVGATALRTRLTSPTPDTVSLAIIDPAGAPIMTIESLAMRAVSPEQLAAARRANSGDLYRMDWTEVSPGEPAVGGQWIVLADPAGPDFGLGLPEHADPASLDPAPEGVVVRVVGDGSDPAQAAHALTERVLRLVQDLPDTRMLIVTRGAMTGLAGQEVLDPAAASVWGLIRSGQAEQPGRLTLVDLDGSAVSARALASALATGEPQLAVRLGKLYAPRLARAELGTADTPAMFDPEGTVLVTGATGALGTLIARRLVTGHDARRLLLVSRRGPAADRADEMVAELTGLGAEVTLTACDAADLEALRTLITSVPAGHPVRAVVHCAGVIDDGLMTSLTPQRLAQVLRPKVDAAWNLHVLTRDLDLTAFVLFSSAIGVLGGPGQANYAAANAFLDALAEQRRAQGLPATSLCWGLWGQETGMAGTLQAADRARMNRTGLKPMPAEHALTLFDQAIAADQAMVIPARFDLTGLRTRAGNDPVAPIFRGLIRGPLRRAAQQSAVSDPSGLRQELAGRTPAEQTRRLLEFIRGHVATILAHSSPDSISYDSPFKSLGFDSLSAVELRNTLNNATGLRLPATLLFDYPTMEALAAQIRSELAGTGDPAAAVLPASRAAAVAAAGGVDDPVVVVGMGCRFPGGVAGPEDLWRLVAEGVDAVGDFPANRGWDATALFDPDPDAVGKTYVRQGGFLYDADQFDAAFFDISPREALALDPQQRVLLEVGWEVFERAGITPATVRGSQVGVFTGVVTQEYVSLCRTGDEGVEGYLLTGTTASVASGRLAYVFGFEGPAVTVDTACSSSLVAVHLACQALRAGECTMALAGGAAVMATPGMFLEFSRQRGLAPDGRCKSFAATADGTIWAEGAGLILLERLSAAQAAGHKILAVIAGSAINQDGASNGLTAPSGPAQQRVIRAALASAGLAPDEVDAVEAHGTGTTLGDPIEAQALIATYGQHRPAGQPLWLGSLKSNIGHAQAAAGIGGIIKMIQAIGHGMLPQTLHVDQPTPHVDWAAGQVELLTQPQPWPGTGRPRRAAVSSFGISGTNAHLILAQPPDPTPATSHSPASGPPPQAATPAAGTPAAGFPGAAGEGGEGGVVAWLVSGKTRTALAAAAGQLATHLEARPDLPAPAVAAALATGRTHHTHRAAAIATTRQDLLSGLQAIATSQPTPRAITVTGTAPASGPPKLAFLCTGQGSWQPGTGRQLHHTYPAFAQAFDQAAQALARHLDGPPIHDLLWGNHQVLLTQTRYAQPALFTLETALFHLLADHGITPDYLAGHSLGELIAAHLAGVLSLDDAAALVATRGQLMHTTPTGVMIAIAASDDEITPLLGPGVTIAALNTPQLTVIAGDPGPTTALAAHFTNLGRKTRQLAVAHAFHSPHMDAITGPFTHAATQPTYHPPTIPLISALTGTDATPTQLADPAYWAAQLTAPVRFHHALTTLHGHGITHYLELGPDTTLTTLTRHTHPDTTAIPTLNPPTPEPTTLTTAIATLHTHGTPTTWTTTPPHPQHHPTLPTYPFQHTHYWLTPTTTNTTLTTAGLTPIHHPLLTAAIPLPDNTTILTGRVSLATHPWLTDHVVHGTVVLPGVAFVDLLLHAAAQVGCDRIEELTHHVFLAIPDQGARQLRLTVGPPGEAGRRPFSLASRPESEEAEWTKNASGFLVAEASPAAADLSAWPPSGAEPVDVAGFYRGFIDRGYEYGPLFRGFTAGWRAGDTIYAEIALPDGTDPERYGIHPALLDSALHPLMLWYPADKVRLPFSWAGVTLHATGATRLRVRLTRSAQDMLSLAISDSAGAPVMTIGSLAMREVDPQQLAAVRTQQSNASYRLRWEPVRLPAQASTPDVWTGLDDAAAAAEMVTGVTTVRDGVIDTVGLELVVTGKTWSEPDDPAANAHAATAAVMVLVQDFLSGDSPDGTRLVVLTRNAIATVDGEGVTDLAAAAVWGLVRAAQSEHPGRVILADLDDSAESQRALAAALATDEPQVALRGGELMVPRLVRAALQADAVEQPTAHLPTDGTVLITGGTGTLGGLLSRHLVERYGVRDLLLVSRRGAAAEGAPGLVAELERHGARVTLADCDVADRAAVDRLLRSVPDSHPLTAIFHTAGVIDDGAIGSLTPERLSAVLRPKIDAAWNLHVLTKDLDLTSFVLYSSVAGMIGQPGQANYAAANTFLDGLAEHRRARGLPGLSLAWGLWAQTTGLTAGLGQQQLARLSRGGIAPLPTGQALDLLDLAIRGDQAVVVPAKLDLGQLAQGTAHVPAVLRGLVGSPLQPAAATSPSTLRQQLAGRGEEHQLDLLTSHIRSQVAAVLGHRSAEEIDVHRGFLEMGLDSLTAIELRNSLNQATGLRLPSTTLFDYPNAAALALLLRDQLAPQAAAAPLPLTTELDELEIRLSTLSPDARAQLSTRLQDMLAKLSADQGSAELLDSATDDEIFDFIDNKLGLS